MNICPACQVGRLQQRNLTYVQWHEKGLLVANHMPAVVCNVCGEHMYDHEAVEHIQRLLWSPPPNPKKSASQNR